MFALKNILTKNSTMVRSVQQTLMKQNGSSILMHQLPYYNFSSEYGMDDNVSYKKQYSSYASPFSGIGKERKEGRSSGNRSSSRDSSDAASSYGGRDSGRGSYGERKQGGGDRNSQYGYGEKSPNKYRRDSNANDEFKTFKAKKQFIETVTLDEITEKVTLADLTPDMSSRLKKAGVAELLPVQQATYKLFLGGREILVK